MFDLLTWITKRTLQPKVSSTKPVITALFLANFFFQKWYHCLPMCTYQKLLSSRRIPSLYSHIQSYKSFDFNSQLPDALAVLYHIAILFVLATNISLLVAEIGSEQAFPNFIFLPFNQFSTLCLGYCRIYNQFYYSWDIVILIPLHSNESCLLGIHIPVWSVLTPVQSLDK